MLGLRCLESFLSQFPHSRVPSRVPPKTSGTKLPIIHTHRTRAPVDTHWRETRHRSEPARESAHPRRVDTQTYIHGAMVVAEKRDKTLCVLITGASRGIGLELVKQYLTRVGRGNYGRGGHVIATCRDPENSLDLLRCFQVGYVSYEVVGLDVASGQSFLDLHEHLRDLDGIEQKHPEALKGPPSIGYGAGRHVPPPSKVNGMNRPESLINGTVPVNPTQPEHRRAVSPPNDYNAALQRELAAAVEEKRRKKRRKEKSKKSSRDRG